MLDLVVRGGLVVTPGGIVRADVGVGDGVIAEVAPDLEGARVIDAVGLHVFPGGLDPHVHFNEPGRTHWEGIKTGSAALAAGGFSAYFDMPLNSTPPVTDGAAFDAKLEAAVRDSSVDFGLWGALVPGAALEELAERGVIGFKAFMSNSGIEDFARADDVTLYEGMATAARLGRLVAVHAENDALTARTLGPTVRDWMNSRPVVAELEAISRAITFAADTGCALHIVHVSSGAGVGLVTEARARGVDVTCETCPHYLFLTPEQVEQIGPVAKCAPPIRDAEDQRRAVGAPARGRDRLRHVRPLPQLARPQGRDVRRGLGRDRGRADDAGAAGRRAGAAAGGADGHGRREAVRDRRQGRDRAGRGRRSRPRRPERGVHARG